jgi:hypothetical protein
MEWGVQRAQDVTSRTHQPEHGASPHAAQRGIRSRKG